MQGFSDDFSTTIQNSHTAVVAAKVIQNGSVVANLEVHAGSVTADRTGAQMRTLEFEVIDRDGTLTPTSMSSLLAPFGSQILLERGVRIKSTEIISGMWNAANPWTPQTSVGQMVSTQIDPSDGSLTLGS